MKAVLREIRRQAIKERADLRDALLRSQRAWRWRKKQTYFRCVEWHFSAMCSGEMKINRHEGQCEIWNAGACDCEIKDRVWVWAHSLPVFVQCSGCGHAPLMPMQVVLLGQLAAAALCD